MGFQAHSGVIKVVEMPQWMHFVVNVLNGTAWPIVVVIVIFLLHKLLANLLASRRSIKLTVPGGLKLELTADEAAGIVQNVLDGIHRLVDDMTADEKCVLTKLNVKSPQQPLEIYPRFVLKAMRRVPGG